MMVNIPQPAKIPWWAKARWIWLITLLAILALPLVAILCTPTSAIFRRTATGWVRMPRPAGLIEKIRVTRGGTLWALTVTPEGSGLSRLQGGSWKQYDSSDFGSQAGFLRGTFAVDGEEVWGAGSHGVVHFDGQRWRLWRDAVVTPKVSSIVAAKGEAWAVDEAGNLSHYTGGVWGKTRLALPGVNWNDHAAQHVPKLALAPDGALWLIRSGVWRFGGTEWARVSSLPAAKLLGVARGSLWLAAGEEVLSIGWDGHSGARYTLSDMRLPPKAAVHEVDGDDTAWFATSAGLVSFDGAAWRLNALPGSGEPAPMNVAAASGTVWAVGLRIPLPLAVLRPVLPAAGLLAILALLALPIWLFAAKRYRARREQELLRQAGGRLPPALQPPPAPKTSFAEEGIALVLALAAVFLLQRLWPQSGGFSLLAVFFAYELFRSVIRSLKLRDVKPSDPIGPGAPPKYDLWKSVGPLSWTLLLFLVFRLDWLLDKLHLRSPGLAYLLPIVVIALGAGGSLLLPWLVDRAVARCDYDGALRLAGLFFWRFGKTPFVRSGILLAAGRYREAETGLREGLSRATKLVERFLLLEDLGNVLMETGRNEEARQCFESARDLKPDRSVATRALAELWLRQGKEPELALELADRALELYRKSPQERVICPERVGEILAVRAWALVLRGRTTEATEAIQEALQGPTRKYRPHLAHVRFLAGMAMRALGRHSEAADHFQRGRDTDPTGRWGTLCASALRQSSAASAS